MRVFYALLLYNSTFAQTSLPPPCVTMMKSKDALPIFLAELIGTGMLMFLGCAGGLNWGHPPSHLQIVLTFGMVILVIIQIFGSVSGAHLNPAVTVSALVYKKVTAPMAGLYIAAQLCGAFMGYGLLKVLTPHSIFAPVGASYGHCMSVVHPEVSLVQAVTIEFLATAVLILIICSLWDPRNAHTLESVSLRFGFAICGLVFALVSVIT